MSSSSSTAFPTGTVTLMFTGIEGAAQFWEKFHNVFYATIEQHNALLRGAIERAGGHVVKIEGDIFMAAFASAAEAVKSAVHIQRDLTSTRWPEPVGAIDVAIGLHTGEPIVGAHPDGSTDYFGPAVNRSARVAAAAHGGQIIVSDATRSAAVAASLPPEFTFVDLGPHALKGVEGVEKLFQVSHPALPAREFPAPNTLSAVRHNIPKPMTSFVGRQIQLDELTARIIHDPNEPVTLIGAAGIGKTRLLQHFATSIAGDFADGAWYVDLANATDGPNAIDCICSTFSLRAQTSFSPLEQLKKFLSGKDLLLILDHATLIPEDAIAILRAADIEFILARVGDVAPAPEVFVVPPLSLPAGDDVDSVKKSESGLLFEDRARDASPAFEISPDNAAAVAQLLRKLEGVPKLIELAAARTRAMSPAQLLDRLSRGMNLLTTRPGGGIDLKIKAPDKP